MSITATVVDQVVSATVTDSGVSVTVSPSTVQASASGGVGPAGPAGVSQLAAATDVALSGLTDGDVLRYSGAASKWTNVNETSLLDAGNF